MDNLDMRVALALGWTEHQLPNRLMVDWKRPNDELFYSVLPKWSTDFNTVWELVLGMGEEIRLIGPGVPTSDDNPHFICPCWTCEKLINHSKFVYGQGPTVTEAICQCFLEWKLNNR